MKNNKGKRILYVLEFLKKSSDENHPVFQSVIARALEKLGIKCDRKTVANDINILIDYGYDIVKIKGGGCYLRNRDFSSEEVSFIIEGLKLLKIDSETKYKIIKKVKMLRCIYEQY